MIPMSEFQNVRHSMRDKLLLLRVRGAKPSYMLGRYDYDNDVFDVTDLPFMNISETEEFKYEEIPSGTGRWKDVVCAFPAGAKGFHKPTGASKYESYMLLESVLESIEGMSIARKDIEEVIKESTFPSEKQYLVMTKDGKLCISRVTSFSNVGQQFFLCKPGSKGMDGQPVHKVLFAGMIEFVVDLEQWEEQTKSRLANIDELYEDIRQMDLSYMQQGGVLECIRDCMERHVRKAGVRK